MEVLVANLSPMDSQVWKCAWLGSMGCSRRRRFRFRWHSRKTAIVTPIPSPITMNSFTSVSFTPAIREECC